MPVSISDEEQEATSMLDEIDASEGTTGRLLSSAVRTLHILEHLAGHKTINLERLAGESGLPKPTLYRFLSTLVDLGYVYRDDNDQYSLTLKMFSIGSKSLVHMDLVRIANPVAEDLGGCLHETVHMGVLDEDQAMYVLKIESRYTIRMYSRVGKRIPLYCTAIGKVLLHGLEDQRLESFLASTEFVPFTRNTIGDAKTLRNALDLVGANGYAEDDEEHEEGIRCIAAPVHDHQGRVVAGLSVSWPVFRFDENSKADYIAAVRQSALTVSKRLGFLGQR
jgi:IclR family KDG regulon transcriptional repressor